MMESIAQSRECGALWWAATAMTFLGTSAWEHAELDLVAAVLREGDAILTQLGELHVHVHAIVALGSVLFQQGDLERGRNLLEKGLAEALAGRFCPDSIGEPLFHLALLARSQGDLIAATQRAVEGLEVMHRAGNPAPVADSLELLGGLDCDHGLPEHSATLFSAAAALRQKICLPMPPILRPAYERDLAATRDALGTHRFAECWAQGLAMTDDQVIEYASQPSTGAAPLER